MLVTVKDDILEMNVVARMTDAKVTYSVAVRRGGHIQPICGTGCATETDALDLLEALSRDLKSGKWVLGTQDARPILKRAV